MAEVLAMIACCVIPMTVWLFVIRMVIASDTYPKDPTHDA